MNICQSLILGTLQGITEFLPISSSGHLVIVEHFFKLNVDTLQSFDVLLHLGTLLAILVYFWRDVLEMIKAFFGFIFGKRRFKDPFVQLVLFVIIGTIPAVIAGFLLKDWIENTFRNISYVAIFMMVVGLVFLIGEFVYKKYSSHKNSVDTWWRALVIGVVQAIALLPGVSRSGSTIVAGLFQGVERSAAARFSFLLGIPAILGAVVLTAIKIPAGEYASMPIGAYSLGFLASFIFGLLSVWFLMKFLKKHSLIVFAIYLLALGEVILLLV